MRNCDVQGCLLLVGPVSVRQAHATGDIDSIHGNEADDIQIMTAVSRNEENQTAKAERLQMVKTKDLLHSAVGDYSSSDVMDGLP